MLRHSKINRIIDANINRAKEGLRVCEEITRFILDNRNLTSEFKRIRQQISRLFKNLASQNTFLLKGRDSLKDIGKNIYIHELKRKDWRDIFFANIQRVKESLRVLEEFSKLKNIGVAVKFKKIRYAVYALEKKTTEKLLALRYHR